MTGELFKPRRAGHECRTPGWGNPSGVDPGDVWRCGCGRYWIAVHVPGSLHPVTGWRPLSRLGGWLRSLKGLPVPLRARHGGSRVPSPRRPAE